MKKYFAIAILTFVLELIFSTLFYKITNHNLLRFAYNIQVGVTDFCSIFMILSAVFLFMKFKTIEIKNNVLNKIITYILDTRVIIC